jgi:hypothetical protein
MRISLYLSFEWIGSVRIRVRDNNIFETRTISFNPLLQFKHMLCFLTVEETGPIQDHTGLLKGALLCVDPLHSTVLC